VELTVNVSANGDRCTDRLYITFLLEDFFGFLTEPLNLILVEGFANVELGDKPI
jgi:hypothetical protein